jgi:hypothetical protein
MSMTFEELEELQAQIEDVLQALVFAPRGTRVLRAPLLLRRLEALLARVPASPSPASQRDALHALQEADLARLLHAAAELQDDDPHWLATLDELRQAIDVRFLALEPFG